MDLNDIKIENENQTCDFCGKTKRELYFQNIQITTSKNGTSICTHCALEISLNNNLLYAKSYLISKGILPINN